MELLNTTVKDFALYGDRLHIFSASGVEIYQLPWLDKRIAWALLPNVSCGTVNDVGVYLGTSDNGVWLLPHGRSGSSTGSLVRVLGTDKFPAIQSEAIAGLAGLGDNLLVTHDAGADYLPDPLTVYSYADASGCGACAIDPTRIAYAVASGLHYDAHPTADWASGDVTVLTDASSPAIVGNTVQDLRFATDLFIATSAGLSIYDGSAVTTKAAPTTAAASSINVTIGTPSGDVTDIQTQDSTYFTITEVATSHGARTEIRFFSDTAITSVNIRGHYGGSAGHTYNVNIYDWNTSSEDNLGTLPDATVDATYTFTTGIVDADHRNQTTGEVLVVLDHVSPGNVTHVTYLDRVWAGITAATVNDCRGVWPDPGATRTSGQVALAYADDADGGRCEVYDLALQETIYQGPGDTDMVWVDDDVQAMICDSDLTRFVQYLAISPARGLGGVRTDWSFYAELLDTQDGIQPGTVVLSIDGSSVSPTITAIDNGYSVAYTPPSASANSKRVAVVLSFTDGDGHTVSRSWSFTTTAATSSETSDSAPPEVVAYRDVSISADEADETVNSVNVIWAEEIRSTLIITRDQAESAGRVVIDEGTYHKHIYNITVLREDDLGVDTLSIQQGDIITSAFEALGLSSQKVEVLAAQRRVSKSGNDNPTHALIVAWYEQVTP